MSRICNVCNSPLSDRAIYCTACGNKIEALPAAEEQKNEIATEYRLIHTPPSHDEKSNLNYTNFSEVFSEQTLYDEKLDKPENRQEKTVSIGMYFLLLFLFALPVVGWIAAIIVFFAAQNKNIKNLAAALLVWVLIGIILLGFLALFLFLIYDPLLKYFGVNDLEDLLHALKIHLD